MRSLDLDFVDPTQFSSDPSADVTLCVRSSGPDAHEDQCFRMLYDALEYRSSRDIALTIHRGGTTKSCRGLVCWCDCGQAIAVTLRDHGRSDGPARQVTLP